MNEVEEALAIHDTEKLREILSHTKNIYEYSYLLGKTIIEGTYEEVRLLLYFGVNPNSFYNNKPVLYHALMRGDPDMVRLLISHRASTDQISYDDWTPVILDHLDIGAAFSKTEQGFENLLNYLALLGRKKDLASVLSDTNKTVTLTEKIND